jgi:hypothetical protein
MEVGFTTIDDIILIDIRAASLYVLLFHLANGPNMMPLSHSRIFLLSSRAYSSCDVPSLWISICQTPLLPQIPTSKTTKVVQALRPDSGVRNFGYAFRTLSLAMILLSAARHFLLVVPVVD